MALFEFASGKTALYDFSGEQYRSFIRSRHVTVRGQKGELTDQILYRLTEENFPETLYLMPELDSRYRQLETKRLRVVSGAGSLSCIWMRLRMNMPLPVCFMI